jgi:site-specific recombinase XerD
MSKPLAIIEHDRIQIPYLFHSDKQTAKRVLEFFAANIRNPHTRKAYGRAVADFASWCDASGITHLRDVQPLHVAAWVEDLQRRVAAPSV